jgi:hypothetical protein
MREADMTTDQIRGGGAVLAALMAFAALLLCGFGTNQLASPVPSYFAGLMVASVIGAALGAAVVAPGVDERGPTIAAALQMTAVACVTAALLWPLAVAATAIPSVVHGGTIPPVAGDIGGLYRVVAGFALSPVTAVAWALGCLGFSLAWSTVFRQGTTTDHALTAAR